MLLSILTLRNEPLACIGNAAGGMQMCPRDRREPPYMKWSFFSPVRTTNKEEAEVGGAL